MTSRQVLRRHVLVPVLIAGLAGMCGCGDSGSRTVSTSALSSAAFVRRANAICAQGRLRGLRYEPSRATGQSEREAVTGAIKATLIPAIQQVIDDIYALGAPRGEEARVEAFLVAFQEAVSEAEGLGVPTFERLEKLFSRPGALAQKDDLDSCVYG